ncbi:heat shock factor protein 5-like [Tachysurus fulvidraco]|uniref:heat shock factor protein 5-like n=1 Tax=Tachysurus fulvidraco TaxID=1234273 RepID=UPI000F4E0071|nr:heat shock factor protein 5-like [Tachysurus fulvidraco]
MSENVDSTEGAEISAGSEVRINRRNFPTNLWHLVNDPQICSICWDDSGEGILICPDAFKAEVLSTVKNQMNKYFKTTNFISFVRQLNLYGFRKVCPDYEISLKQVSLIQHFFNPNFKRANPELLVNLKRLTPANKAKLASGQQVSRQSRPFHQMLNSPENSAVVGTDLSEHQGTTDHMYSQQVKGSDTKPQTSQVFVAGHDDSSSEFCHFQMDFPCVDPSSPMQKVSYCSVPDGNFSAYSSPCSFSAPVNHCGIPDFLDSKMPCSQQDVASTHCGYYTDYSFSHLQYTDQDPSWQSADAPDPRKSHMNKGTVFNAEDEMQVAGFFTLPTNDLSL